MTGKVKSFYHDEICERANNEPWGPEPDELEMLKIDAEQSNERYQAALKKRAENHKAAAE